MSLRTENRTYSIANHAENKPII